MRVSLACRLDLSPTVVLPTDGVCMPVDPSPNIIDAAEVIGDLSNEQCARLASAIEQTQPALDLSEFASAVASIAEIDEESVRKVVLGVATILPIAPDITEDVSKYIANVYLSDDAELEKHESLSKCLHRILLCGRTLGITSKAHNVMWGTGHTYFNARTLSQIRPIFYDADPEEAPEHAVIVHELRINYRTNDYTTDFVVSMDRQQIRSLIQVLGRAVDKEQAIRSKGGYSFMERKSE